MKHYLQLKQVLAAKLQRRRSKGECGLDARHLFFFQIYNDYFLKFQIAWYHLQPRSGN